MAEYTPLMATSPEECLYAELESKEHTLKAHSLRYPLFCSVLIAILAISAAGAFHLSVSTTTTSIRLLTPKEVDATFQRVLPSPNLEKGKDYVHQLNLRQPVMTFPMYMTRANAALPATVYTSGSSIVLSPTDSMIYHWTINSRWQKCYVTGYVSAYDELLAAGKTYYHSEGDITSIEIWNVTTPPKIQALKNLSWNTRPERVSLLGTVNFTTVDVQRKVLELDGQELRAPTPRFDCLGDLKLTIEIVCTTCSLQFEQVFSSPPLGFELMQLG
ncbi:hypothetical protein C8R47DRAFT_290156 [Mycena vitilis]|nr:hypothetical protein C8R47DRAFT_290156 [Mycena vitilis]